jgi:hypothetical protein
MKYALQIYGTFRTFEHCLPQILEYIYYDELDYDVFILSEMKDGYSIENEERIKKILGNKIIEFKYIDTHYNDGYKIENRYLNIYNDCVKTAKKTIQKELISNNFVSKLWYRRYLNNNMRKDYSLKSGQKYDWVIRTRFDIGYDIIDKLEILKSFPDNDKIYMIPDIISCGTESAIDCESNLIHYFPYIYLNYKNNGKIPTSINNFKMIKKWLFMSELNLVEYISNTKYKVLYLSQNLKIIRNYDINR